MSECAYLGFGAVVLIVVVLWVSIGLAGWTLKRWRGGEQAA